MQDCCLTLLHKATMYRNALSVSPLPG